MADGNYDNTNRGVIFQPHQNQRLVGQGNLNIDGRESRVVIVREPVQRDGQPVRVVYQKVGVLFDNDKNGNENAPDYSGPLDTPPNKRVAAWVREKDGRHYMSLNVSDRQQQGGNGGQQGGNGQTQGSDAGYGYGGGYDDEIPF